jgi:Rrf2 family transcriptional regulator, cysteine metabolism repressor
MKMSTKGRYGLRVMMELANHYGCGPTPVDTIARNQGISGKYIHILVMGLRSAGLVRTLRGPNGGYELTRAPHAITALDVVTALEGKNAPVECVVDTAFCPRTNGCAARDVWCDVAAAIDDVLAGLTLEELASRQRVSTEEQPSYYI